MKTAVIMGGNSGIGKATAKILATKGYKIIIHGRDEQKTKAAVTEIKANGNSSIDFVTGDLSSIAGMKKVAAEIQNKTDVIDALVLSTGVILPTRVETADGMEAAFTTQYLCRFAMVQMLSPQLKKANLAHIVSVGAPTLKKAKIHFDDLSLKNNFSMMNSMGQCMLANHMMVQEFAKRNKGSNLCMNIFHVGVAKTGVGREMNFFLRTLISMFGASPDKACANAVFLADDSEANFSGYFLTKPGKPQVKEQISFDAAATEQLWNVSAGLIK